MNLNDLPQLGLSPDTFRLVLIWTLFVVLSIIATFLLLKRGPTVALIPIWIAAILSIPVIITVEQGRNAEKQSRDDAVNSWINDTYELKEIVALEVESSGGKWDKSTDLNIRNGGAYYALRVDTDGNLVLLEGVSEAPLKEALLNSK